VPSTRRWLPSSNRRRESPPETNLEAPEKAALEPRRAAAIGWHRYHAGEPQAALPYLVLAGEAALAQHDPATALVSLDLACRAADLQQSSEADVARRLHLGLARSRALQRLAAWDAAGDELEPLLVLARGWGQDAAAIRILRAQGEIEYARGRFDEAILRWLEAQAGAATCGDENQFHELALQIGNIHFEQGTLDAAAAEYQRVLEYATRTGQAELEARAANNVALIESIQGRKQAAVQYFNRSLERFRALGRIDAMARLNQNIGQIYLEFGNWAEARNFFQRSMEECEASRQPALLAIACLDCAEANLRLGAHAEAAAAAERALSISRECGDEIGIANAHRVQASLAAAAGDPARAEARLLESIDTLQRLGQPLQLGLCWKELGAVRLQAGRAEPAAAALDQARALFASLDAEQHVADVDALRARCKAVNACPP
jgi:tetratricopeptide (TPR) repeat protein